MTTIKVPDKYGYVILSCVVVPLFSFFYMGGSVMKARKEFNVQYPNLYATPGYHKQADEFNRVQRGHQNMLESWTTFTAASLLGGLMHPIAVSIFGILYSAGNILFLAGYSDAKLDVATARFKKGGKYIISSLGVLFVSNVYFSYKLSLSLAGSNRRDQVYWHVRCCRSLHFSCRLHERVVVNAF
jgi:glutathione S-transferase